MDAESFTALALRVLAHEASEHELRAFEEELASAPARREEFAQLGSILAVAQIAMPVAQALQTDAPELPLHRVNELRTAVRQHFGPAKRAAAFEGSRAWTWILRWFFGGSGIAALGFAVIILCFANRTVEVGLYETDLQRGIDPTLSAGDIPSAHVVTFEQDAPFDQWKNQPLAWNEHAKIWVDNEHDLLHLVRRVRTGQIITETQPLAPTDEAQRKQIQQLVEQLR
jgi:hypothetical protein